MNKLFAYFINRPKVVNLLTISCIVFGLLTMTQIQKQAYPPVDGGKVQITTIIPGASPSDVERNVTSKIEKQLKGLSSIKEIKSFSLNSFSHITVKLENDSDYENALVDVRKLVDQVSDLPNNVKGKPLVILPNLDDLPVILLAMTGTANYDLKRKYVLALEKYIQKNPLVGNIYKRGYLEKEVHIETDSKKLQSMYISLGSIISAIKSHNIQLSAGDIISETNEQNIIINSEFKKLDDVRNVIIRSDFKGNNVKISDIAKIVEKYEKKDKAFNYMGLDSIQLIINKKPKADIVKASKSIRKMLIPFKKTLPHNIELNLVADHAEEAINLLDLVLNNAWTGLFLVCLMLLLFLNKNIAFWTALGVPTTIFLGITFFPIFKITINSISLIAIIIVLGMLMDDAIIIAENIYSYIEKGYERKEAALLGLMGVIKPVAASTITTIITFLPLLVIKGPFGKVMFMMPIVVTLMLIGSLLEGMFILPCHIAHMKATVKKKVFFKTLEKYYRNILLITLKHKYKTILLFFTLLFFAFLLASYKMKFILYPTSDSRSGYIFFETAKGSSLEETRKIAKSLENIVLSFSKNEISGFETIIGENQPLVARVHQTTIKSNYMGNIMLYFTPREERERETKEIMQEIKDKSFSLKEFKKIETKTFIAGPAIGRPVSVTIINNDDDSRNKLANELKLFLSTIPGVYNFEDNHAKGKKSLFIQFNYDLMSRLGVNPAAVAETIHTAFEGSVATKLKWKSDEVKYRVILSEKDRSNVNILESLLVQNYLGKLIPLNQFIKITNEETVFRINHSDGDRSITIFADIDTKINTSIAVNNLIRKRFNHIIKKDPDMYMIFGGEGKDTQESLDSLFIAFILAVIGVYLVLAILFNSYVQPLLVMILIPFSIAGVIYAFYLSKMHLSFPALIGVVGLTGVVVNDSLVMITSLNTKLAEDVPSIESMADTAQTRLRPIILTTVTTVAGLIPTAYGFGGYDPLIIPLVMAMLWGLVFATFVTLIFVPSLYLALRLFLRFIEKKFNTNSYKYLIIDK